MLVVIVALAVLVRATIDFSTPLMPKVNGAYYLVQALNERRPVHYLAVGVFLFLGSITHVGAFGATFGYSLAAFGVLLFMRRFSFRRVLVLLCGATILYAAVSYGLFAGFRPDCIPDPAQQ